MDLKLTKSLEKLKPFSFNILMQVFLCVTVSAFIIMTHFYFTSKFRGGNHCVFLQLNRKPALESRLPTSSMCHTFSFHLLKCTIFFYTGNCCDEINYLLPFWLTYFQVFSKCSLIQELAEINSSSCAVSSEQKKLFSVLEPLLGI